jgi:hypothetical protein
VIQRRCFGHSDNSKFGRRVRKRAIRLAGHIQLNELSADAFGNGSAISLVALRDPDRCCGLGLRFCDGRADSGSAPR